MIPVLDFGRGFRGVLEYATHKPGAYLIGAIRGEPDELVQAFGVFRSLNASCQNPVLHLSLSLAVGERLDDAQWERAADEMMEGLGYGGHFYVVARHTDTAHEHIHIIASRIGPDGKVNSVSFEKRKASAITARLERRFGLRRAALEWGERPGERRAARLRRLIDAASAAPSAADWVDRLERLGVGVKANIGGEHVSGVSFWHEGRLIKGSALGRAYSWGALARRLGYGRDGDLDRLRRAGAATAQSMAAAKARRTANRRVDHSAERRDLLGLLGGLAMSAGRSLSREARKSSDGEEEPDRDRERTRN